MPLNKYFSGHGKEVMASMSKEYGAKKGKQVFYATANKRKKKPGGMVGKMTELHMAGKLKKK